MSRHTNRCGKGRTTSSQRMRTIRIADSTNTIQHLLSLPKTCLYVTGSHFPKRKRKNKGSLGLCGVSLCKIEIVSTGHKGEPGIATRGTACTFSKNWFVFDHFNEINNTLLPNLTSCHVNCFLASNPATESGTKFDLRAINKKLNTKKDQKVISDCCVKSKQAWICSKILGVIGATWLGPRNWILDNPFNNKRINSESKTLAL